MNCDLIDFRQETINCNGVNLEIFFLLYLMGYQATWLPILLLVANWRPQISHVFE